MTTEQATATNIKLVLWGFFSQILDVLSWKWNTFPFKKQQMPSKFAFLINKWQMNIRNYLFGTKREF